jgi:hypothetical protein
LIHRLEVERQPRRRKWIADVYQEYAV